MNLEIRPATGPEIVRVCENMAARTREECALMGWTPAEMLRKLAQFLETGEAHIMWLGDEPLVMLAIAEHVDRTHYTWLVPTDRYFEIGYPAIRASRRHMAKMVDRHGLIASLITSTHPDVERWMRLLGARLIEHLPMVRSFVFA